MLRAAANIIDTSLRVYGSDEFIMRCSTVGQNGHSSITECRKAKNIDELYEILHYH